MQIDVVDHIGVAVVSSANPRVEGVRMPHSSDRGCLGGVCHVDVISFPGIHVREREKGRSYEVPENLRALQTEEEEAVEEGQHPVRFLPCHRGVREGDTGKIRPLRHPETRHGTAENYRRWDERSEPRIHVGALVDEEGAHGEHQSEFGSYAMYDRGSQETEKDEASRDAGQSCQPQPGLGVDAALQVPQREERGVEEHETGA